MLAATTSSVGAEQPGETRVSGWSTSLVDSGDEMRGRFTQDRRIQNLFGWQESMEDCEIVELTAHPTRSALHASSSFFFSLLTVG